MGVKINTLGIINSNPMGLESGPKNEVPEQETQENQAENERRLEAHHAAMVLRTLTEGGFERSEAAKKSLLP